MRARMAIVASNIHVELREVELRDKPQALRAISVKATVPVLLTSDNTVIDESLDIMNWALKQSDPDNWLKDRNDELIANNDGDFKYWLDRYKYADRYPEHSEQYYRQQGEKTLLMLDTILGKSVYLAGNSISFTDIALFPFMRQFAFADRNWFDQSPYPKLRAWLNELIDSNLFQTAMFKYQPWKQEDNIVTLFPVKD